jgi:hypothetical protein
MVELLDSRKQNPRKYQTMQDAVQRTLTLQGLFVAGPVIDASTATLRRQRIETEDAIPNQPSRHRKYRADRTLLSGGTRVPREIKANQPKRFRLAERSARLLAPERSYSIFLSHRSD